jgi:uncharacterized protein
MKLILRSILTHISILVLFLLSAGGCNNQNGDTASRSQNENIDQSFDSELAQELNADEYGMRRYVMAFLKAGPNRDHDPDTVMEIQQAHMDNINRMANEGSLILAGPFLDDGQFRGIYLFDVETIEEARKLTQSDPAIQAGRLEMELHPWYGSAALMKVNDIHRTISKEIP